MLSKIVFFSLTALAAGQVQVIGSPEWQEWENFKLAWQAPSIGPTPENNYAQAELNHISPSEGLTPANHAQFLLDHQAKALAFVNGRKKRQVSVEGSPEWQAWKAAELAYIAPSPGPTPVNYAQAQLNHQAAALAFVNGRKKRQVSVVGSPEWQAWKAAELAHIAPSPGPTPINYAQSELNYIAPSPGPTPINYAQAQLNHQQAALNFIAGH